MSTVLGVFRQAIHPSRLKVMAGKVLRRLEKDDTQKNMAWLEANATSFEASIAAQNPGLWAEAVDAANAIDARAQAKLRTLPVQLGGAGATPYLYYLARLLKPEVIVETGVAAGHSSQAFLMAIRKNGRGRLYSSDFPYFRLDHPEQYIGIVVDEELKEDWELHIEGDEVNLPRILQKVRKVDLVHYDSDKSYRGRALALKALSPLLGAESIVLMDDIQDNAFFLDTVAGLADDQWRVFGYQGKYVGLLGDEERMKTLR
jgi:predicted O-methyltransferase YrrM